MTHARTALGWLTVVGGFALIVGYGLQREEPAATPSRCPADCRIRLARGRPDLCIRYRIEVLTEPICVLHNRPAR
jgi:hypothetical protein